MQIVLNLTRQAILKKRLIRFNKRSLSAFTDKERQKKRKTSEHIDIQKGKKIRRKKKNLELCKILNNKSLHLSP